MSWRDQCPHPVPNFTQLGERSSESVSELTNNCDRTSKLEISRPNRPAESSLSEGVEDLLAAILIKIQNEIVPATLDEVLSSANERKPQSDKEQDLPNPKPLWKSNSGDITEVLLKVLDKVRNEIVVVTSEESLSTRKPSPGFHSENDAEKFMSYCRTTRKD